MAEHTPGPWVGFSDQGKLVAIMPAGRAGDICTFKLPPSNADAALMLAAPALVKALVGIAEYCSGDNTTLGAIHRLVSIRNTAERALAAVGCSRND